MSKQNNSQSVSSSRLEEKSQEIQNIGRMSDPNPNNSESKEVLPKQERDKELPILKVNVSLKELQNGGLGKVLGEMKRVRKQAEMEAQLLESRINLLKSEEENSRKKIIQTQKQIIVQLDLKKMNEEQNAQRKRDEAFIQSQREEKYGLSEKERQKRKETKDLINMELKDEKRANYLMVKQERIDNENRIRRSAERSFDKNKRSRLEIQQQEMQGKYREEIQEHDRYNQQKLQQIKEMEVAEINLIRKLQATQSVQKQIQNEQKAIGKLSVEDFTNQFSPSYSKKQVDQLIEKQFSTRTIPAYKSVTSSQVSLPGIEKPSDFYNLSAQNGSEEISIFSSKTGRSYKGNNRSLQKNSQVDDSLIAAAKSKEPATERNGIKKHKLVNTIHKKKKKNPKHIEVLKDFVF